MLFHQPENPSHYYFSCQIIIPNLPSFSKWFFKIIQIHCLIPLLHLFLNSIIYSTDITLARSSVRFIFLNLFDSPCLSYLSHHLYLKQLIHPPSLKHFFILFSRLYMLLAFLLNWFLFCVFPPRSSSQPQRSYLIVGLTYILVFDLSLSLLTSASSMISWGLGI